MRTKIIVALCATLTMAVACGDDAQGDGYTSAGDGDGDGDDTSGDGDATSGDGDGDPTTSGDGDGDDGIAIDPDNMIDNMEDGDGALIPNGGRQGYWYTFNDESEEATQTPASDAVLP